MNRIRLVRQTLGISQRTLEAMSGVSQAAISRYENGDADVSGESLIQLCKVFNCSADYLLGMTDDPRSYRADEPITVQEYALLQAWRAGDLRLVLRLLAGQGDEE